jgi:membrane protease subunit HflK
MPWSNQSGGPWGGGNNPGGPWGQGPSGPRGGGNPPDLEEIIRRGQDRLRQALPGGGQSSRLLWIVVAVALVGLWLFKAVYTVQPDERAIELRFGVPKNEISMPGIHTILWPLETVEIASIVERQVSIGSNTRGGSPGSGLMLSGDQNIVDVTFAVLYSVIDPRAFLFNVRNPDEVARQVAESAMREIVGRRPAQDVFRDKRQDIANDVRGIIQNILDNYGAGIAINTVSIEDAAPPRPVADAFDEVQRAEQDEDRFVEESNQYFNQKLGAARGQAAQVREAAAAYKDRVVKEAEGEAQRFLSVYGEYAKAPEVTRKRLFLETMESVLRDSSKVIIEQNGGQGVVPYLPLPEIGKNRDTKGANQ